MTREQLLALHDKLSRQARDIIAKKNADYGDPDDCFGNLRLCEQMKLCSMPKGILIRMADKIRRVANLLDRPALVAETAEDNVLDVINYAILLLASLTPDPLSKEPT